MTPQEIDSKFHQLQQELPAEVQAWARKYKAFQRSRRIKMVSDLLRAVMLYSICDLSLREIAGWFTGRGQRMTDEAVRGRLKCCAKWIEAVVGKMLPVVERPPLPDGKKAWKLVIRDGSVVNGPGSRGTDYRLHLSFDPIGQTIDELHLYDAHTSESLSLFGHGENAIEIGDRGFAKAAALIATRNTGAHFCVRMTPNYLALRDRSSNKLDLIEQLRGAGETIDLSFEVLVHETKTGETCEAYLHAHRLSEQESNRARRRTKLRARKKGHTLRATTLLLCDWLLILTSVPPGELPARVIFELYRVRWQVELLIKRFKSLLQADCLRAHAGSPLSEVYLLGKFLFALLIESRTLKRVGNDWMRMIGSRSATCWRPWKLIAAEIKEVVLNTVGWDNLDWREMLNVLGERQRKRKLQLIPDAVAQWLRVTPVMGPH
jgi:alkylhydroperoxidase family enzyme